VAAFLAEASRGTSSTICSPSGSSTFRSRRQQHLFVQGSSISSPSLAASVGSVLPIPSLAAAGNLLSLLPLPLTAASRQVLVSSGPEESCVEHEGGVGSAVGWGTASSTRLNDFKSSQVNPFLVSNPSYSTRSNLDLTHLCRSRQGCVDFSSNTVVLANVSLDLTASSNTDGDTAAQGHDGSGRDSDDGVGVGWRCEATSTYVVNRHHRQQHHFVFLDF
jgi:hypothetical protein